MKTTTSGEARRGEARRVGGKRRARVREARAKETTDGDASLESAGSVRSEQAELSRDKGASERRG